MWEGPGWPLWHHRKRVVGVDLPGRLSRVLPVSSASCQQLSRLSHPPPRPRLYRSFPARLSPRNHALAYSHDLTDSHSTPPLQGCLFQGEADFGIRFA
jgi:hypothetical protein